MRAGMGGWHWPATQGEGRYPVPMSFRILTLPTSRLIESCACSRSCTRLHWFHPSPTPSYPYRVRSTSTMDGKRLRKYMPQVAGSQESQRSVTTFPSSSCQGWKAPRRGPTCPTGDKLQGCYRQPRPPAPQSWGWGGRWGLFLRVACVVHLRPWFLLLVPCLPGVGWG